jgi:hypothetical protein
MMAAILPMLDDGAPFQIKEKRKKVQRFSFPFFFFFLFHAR